MWDGWSVMGAGRESYRNSLFSAANGPEVQCSAPNGGITRGTGYATLALTPEFAPNICYDSPSESRRLIARCNIDC